MKGALELQKMLIGKQLYLARYNYFSIHMSMETMTTSPVESTNDLIKHEHQVVDSNMKLSKSVQIMTNAIDKRFENHCKKSLHEMNVINRVSQSKTK